MIVFAAGDYQSRATHHESLPSWPRSASLVRKGNAPGRASITVRFRTGLSRAARRRLLAQLGAVETGSVPQLGLHVVSVAPARAQTLLHRLRAAHAVVAATPDDVRQISGDTSAALSRQWALRKIGWQSAYDAATLKRNVRIAILDTGIQGLRTSAGFTAFPDSSPTA